MPKLLEMLVLETPRPEIIVVDGGSNDGTVNTARIWADRVHETMPGRGQQLNLGAREASGDILWFFHADSTPPPRSVTKILELMHNRPELDGGAFRLKFDRDTFAMRTIAWGANLRSRWLSMPWGDQGLFVRRSVFLELGGFPDWPILEDFQFQRLLARHGKTYLLRDKLTTSARRYEKLGAMRAMAMNFNTLWWHYRGKSPASLQAKFRPFVEQGGGADEK
ncbi:MAG: TIGR04283 family arsenosugar biosynthesis glycosyltransferase [bacterium]|nr:TIGR04283 family arsenosugar biosynthesis glycosyltransferase [bacterium]